MPCANPSQKSEPMMNLDLIKRVIETSPPVESDDFDWSEDSPLSKIWRDDTDEVTYWVDWREEDDAIPEYCEGVLKTGCLSAECVEIEEEPGFAVDITYKGKVTRVPLVVGAADRPITMFTLNQVLEPDYEVRYLRASECTDSWCCVPLPTSAWRELEAQYGDRVDWAFTRITMPDLEEYARAEALFDRPTPSAPEVPPMPAAATAAAPAPAFGAGTPGFDQRKPSPYASSQNVRPLKRKSTALILAIFFGVAGTHRYYLGKYASGALFSLLFMILQVTRMAPLMMFFVVIDIAFIATGKMKDGYGRPLV
jgi:TM2 domain